MLQFKRFISHPCALSFSIRASLIYGYIVYIDLWLICNLLHVVAHFPDIGEAQRRENLLEIATVAFFKEVNVHFLC